MQKKFLLSLVFIIGLVLIIGAVIFLLNQNIVNKNETDIIVNQNCNPYLDIQTAVTNQDVKGCDCLKDKATQEVCKMNITDAISYSQASIQTNSSFCENISAQEMKNDCLKLVQAKIDFINKSIKAAGKK